MSDMQIVGYPSPGKGLIVPKENSEAVHKLAAVSIPKNGKYYVLVPEIALLLKSDKKVESVTVTEREYWLARGNLDNIKRFQMEENVIDKVSIVPTGYCEGGCKYCYAKDGWDIDGYLTPKMFDDTMARHNVKDIKDVIIYGGEPVYNFEAYHTLLKHLLFERNVASICTVTSFFYDDETYEKLKQVAQTYGTRLHFSISMDSESKPGQYLRQYKGKDTFQFILDRLKDFVKVTHQMGVRQTVSRVSPNPFDLLRRLERETGFVIPTTIDLVKYNGGMVLTDEQYGKFKWDMLDYIQEYYYSGKVTNVQQMFKPFGKIMETEMIFNLIKNCDMGTNRIAVMPDGGVSDCTEDVKMGHPQTYDKKTEENYKRVYDFKKVCGKCDYKYMCNLTCFQLLGGAEEGDKAQEQYCDFQVFNNMEGLKFFIHSQTEEKCDFLAACSQQDRGVTCAS